jgi:hypothetical protein
VIGSCRLSAQVIKSLHSVSSGKSPVKASTSAIVKDLEFRREDGPCTLILYFQYFTEPLSLTLF